MQNTSENLTQLTYVQEQELLGVLQGGLKGRFAREFCLLQGAVDALDRQFSQQFSPALQAELAPLLRQMEHQINVLERLADHAVELAGEPALRTPRHKTLLDMTEYLQDLCTVANRELAGAGSAAQVVLQLPEPPAPWPMEAPREQLDILFANLFSNSVQAKSDTTITLQCLPDYCLLYSDTGPGLPPQTLTGPVDKGGRMGLLVVQLLANELGWQVTQQARPGADFAVTFRLVPLQTAPEQAALRSTDSDRAFMRRRQAETLRREFAATLNGYSV